VNAGDTFVSRVLEGFMRRLHAPSLVVAAETDVERQVREMQERMQKVDDQIQAASDQLESANQRVDEQSQLIEQSGLAQTRGASSGLLLSRVPSTM
jgi:hypothetical protein